MSGQDITQESNEIKTFGLHCEKGIMVMSVEKEGPADKARLAKFDVITAFDDEPVERVDDLHKVLTEDKIDKKARLTIMRMSEKLTLEIVPVELKADAGSEHLTIER